jgi:hypothetical protein
MHKKGLARPHYRNDETISILAIYDSLVVRVNEPHAASCHLAKSAHLCDTAIKAGQPQGKSIAHPVPSKSTLKSTFGPLTTASEKPSAWDSMHTVAFLLRPYKSATLIVGSMPACLPAYVLQVPLLPRPLRPAQQTNQPICDKSAK